MIQFSQQARWIPYVTGALDPKPGVATLFTPIVPIHRKFSFGFHAVPFEPAELMTEFWLLSKQTVLGDVLPVRGCWGCSAEFKDLVEALEPGVHQFFPITIRRPDGKAILRTDGREVGPGQYFILNALQAVDALLPEHCIGLRGAKRQKLSELSRNDDLCVSRSAVAGRRLWINEPFFVSGGYFISESLGAALRQRNWKGFQFRKVREI